MEPGRPCRFVSEEGCGIFGEARRPKHPCEVFECGWLIDDSPLPDWMQPHLSGVITLIYARFGSHLVIRANPIGRKIPARSLDFLKKLASRNRTPLVWFEWTGEPGQAGGRRVFGMGPPEFIRWVRESGAPGDTMDAPQEKGA